MKDYSSGQKANKKDEAPWNLSLTDDGGFEILDLRIEQQLLLLGSVEYSLSLV